MSRSRFLGALLLLCLLLPSLPSCASKKSTYSVTVYDCFDTFSTLTVYAESEEEAEGYFSVFREALTYYHTILNVYDDGNGTVNLKTVNQSAGAPVTVPSELFDFLSYAKEAYTLTKGYTNLAMGAPVALWHEARLSESPAPPDSAALAEAMKHTDLSLVLLDGESSTVTVTDPLIRLDAGALGKGYAADRIKERLTDAGAEAFLLNLGGTLLCHGTKPSGELWTLQADHPQDADGTPYRLSVREGALATSSDQFRSFVHNGVTYHHVLHPETGTPSGELRSVTVYARSAAMADALSTALFSMTPEEALTLIASVEGAEAVLYPTDGERICSDGFPTKGDRQ